MIPGQSVMLAIDEASMVGEARRVAARLAGTLGFDETGRGRASLVATEFATNLIKHAGSGELIFRALERGDACGLEVLALDRGPGMADVGSCLADGFSTAGSPGAGLGALSRLSPAFDIHSIPGSGTAASARLWAVPGVIGPAVADVELGVVSLPAPGEEVCGDAWAVDDGPDGCRILLVDGLGHGPQAAEAARAAVRAFHASTAPGLVEMLWQAHHALKSTRGAAMAVAHLDRARGEVRFAGVGNIAGVVVLPGEERNTSMVSQNGTVGHAVRKVQEFTYPWPEGALLIMHSDGLASQWRLDRYAGLSARRPSLVAGVLYRDFRRGRDDVTVLAAREGSAGPPC